MAFEILMPKLSSTMEEGSVTQWFKEEGDSVEVGEAIFEVMTDKIAIEVEAYEEGILLKRYYEIDESVPINSVIGYIGEKDETVPETAPNSQSATKSLPEPATLNKNSESEPLSSLIDFQSEKVRATPAARKTARLHDIDLQKISGSGTNGRIHVIDVKNYQATTTMRTKIPEEAQVTVIPWRGMRKVIATQMVRSKTDKPHVTMNADVDISEVNRLREGLLPEIEKQTGYRLSYTEIIIKALTLSLKQHPTLNAITKEDGIYQFLDANIGVAVALEEGLIVPVITQANYLNLAELTIAVKENAEKARTGSLSPEALLNGTFTISSLGNSVVKSFTPIINAPEVAILGVGGVYDAPYIDKKGEIKIIKQLTLSLSFDHRAIDGATAAAFLSTLITYLENPYKLLL